MTKAVLPVGKAVTTYVPVKVDEEGRVYVISAGGVVSAEWVYGNIISAPSSNTDLVSFTVPSDKKADLYGIHISSPEKNDFNVMLDNDIKFRLSMPYGGVAFILVPVPLIKAKAGQTIHIQNVWSGGSEMEYQANIAVFCR